MTVQVGDRYADGGGSTGSAAILVDAGSLIALKPDTDRGAVTVRTGRGPEPQSHAPSSAESSPILRGCYRPCPEPPASVGTRRPSPIDRRKVQMVKRVAVLVLPPAA